MEKKYYKKETTIMELGLSTRAYNFLERAGIRTLGDLEEKIHCMKDIIRLRDAGKKSAEELQNKLIELGIIVIENGKFRYPRKNRDLFLSTELYKLGIHYADFFEDILNAPKTLGELLVYLIEGDLLKIKNVNELNIIIQNLNIPGIHFGMSKEEIEELYVTDEMFTLLNSIIENISLNRQKEIERLAERRLTEVTEDNKSLETRIENNSLVKQINTSIENIKDSIEQKKVLLQELQRLSEEKQKLEQLNQQLDEQIKALMMKMFGDEKDAKRK